MKKILFPAVTLIVGLVIGAVAAGNVTPGKERVRDALYSACVNGTHYAPAKTGNDLDASLACNRQSIDLSLAIIYGDSYMPPIESKQYEAALDKYKGR